MHFKQSILIASLVTAHTVSASCLHGTSLLPRRMRGREVEVSDFSYTGLTGPLNWAGIKPENFACASASVQSPINIDESISLAEQQPQIAIPNVAAAEFENLGTTVEVIVNGSTLVGGQEFTLKQFHFHTPSEHRIGNEYFPAEMHMVHEAADGSGQIAVMSVLFELSTDGSTTDLLTNVIGNIGNIAEPGSVTETGPLNFDPLVQHLSTTPLFQYSGSLTTPPCAEGLTFLITAVPLPINVQTFRALKGVVKFNSRYTQNNLGEQNLILVAGGNQEVNTAICNAGVFNAAEANANATETATATEAEETAAEETATATASEAEVTNVEENATGTAEEEATNTAEEPQETGEAEAANVNLNVEQEQGQQEQGQQEEGQAQGQGQGQGGHQGGQGGHGQGQGQRECRSRMCRKRRDVRRLAY